MRQGCIRGVYGIDFLPLSIYYWYMSTKPKRESQIHEAFAAFIEEWAADLKPRAGCAGAPAYGAHEDFNPLDRFAMEQKNAAGQTSRID